MSQVGVVIGSKSDQILIQPMLELLEQLGIKYEFSIISAHRNPEKVRQFALQAKDKGFALIIAVAGAAAHLPGVIASWTTLPVIGVPLPTSDLKGIDSLLSIVQMPAGVPVACVGIGTSGAKNAALLAGQILGLNDKDIQSAIFKYKEKLAQS
jgi:5-(carboxyamino)imidazole ribonucleotide mutase